MSRPSRRTVRIATWSAVPVALLASAAVVATSSYAAFSATTDNPTNNWSAGTVSLSDDDGGTAMFTAQKLKPGATGTKCITVTSAGTLPGKVVLYGTAPSTTKGLADAITLKVEQGTGGSFASCAEFTAAKEIFTGSLATFGAAHTNYATGVGDWATTGSPAESKTYRITYTLGADTPNSAQGGTASVGLTWEAQNS